jgi:hypothetical protein
MASPPLSPTPVTPSKPQKPRGSAKTSFAIAEKWIKAGQLATTPDTPVKKEDKDEQFPAQKNKILESALGYAARDFVTPSEYLKAHGGGESSNQESLEDFEDLPCLPPPSTPCKERLVPATGQITIIHEYLYAFSSSPYSKHTVEDILRHLTDVTKYYSTGSSVCTVQASELTSIDSLATLEAYSIPELDLVYCANNMPEIPANTYNISNYQALPSDWESSAFISIRGRPIPIKY